MRQFQRMTALFAAALALTFAIALLIAFFFSPPPAQAQALPDNPHNRTPNNLAGLASPYLQQHVYNAVNWYPWGEEALEKARIENKPIFLSVGYSTCHWCRVMAEESFEDEEIGAFLNQHFVSIKIDRERRPDLDEQFMLVTQVITGGGGWPNTVFLTPEKNPFYAGTYFPPQDFLDLLQQLVALWEDDRANLLADGARIGDTVRQYMSRSAAARDLTPEAITAAADILLDDVDVFYGGFGVAPKFPREANLLFLLDQAERRADPDLLTVVTEALDGMLIGGIHDQIGGGFHRYTVDESWQIPHFEKMLYNQALIGRLLVRAYAATGKFRYRRAAIRTFDYVLRKMRAPAGGFYSAQDADSMGTEGKLEEGVYYLWTPRQITAALDADAPFALDALGVTEEGNFEGTNILHLKQLPGENQIEFYTRLDAVLNQLHTARNNRIPPHRDEKIVVDWNASMIETLAEAASVLQRPHYYQTALNAADYITTQMMAANGDLNRISFEGGVGTPALLSDYAGLGVAFLALFDHAPDGVEPKALLESAQQLAGQITTRFADPRSENTPFSMKSEPDGLGKFLPIDDSEVPAGNALALALFDGLAKRTGDPQYARQARLLAAALSGHALAAPHLRGYTLRTALALSHGETGPIRYLANGVVKVTSSVDRQNNTTSVSFDIAKGWHINASVPLEDYLIPTQMSVSGMALPAENFPAPIIKALGFNAQPLALYEGTLQLSAPLPQNTSSDPGQVLLVLQTCSDQICLAPEEVTFTLW